MTPEQRKQAVANRPPETQKQILAKVREYLSLKPEDREARLQATELRWYLFPILHTPATNRPAQLAFIPADLRKLAEDRLAAGFIADGIHLPASFLKVALRAKGPERSVLVTDASSDPRFAPEWPLASSA